MPKSKTPPRLIQVIVRDAEGKTLAVKPAYSKYAAKQLRLSHERLG